MTISLRSTSGLRSPATTERLPKSDSEAAVRKLSTTLADTKSSPLQKLIACRSFLKSPQTPQLSPNQKLVVAAKMSKLLNEAVASDSQFNILRIFCEMNSGSTTPATQNITDDSLNEALQPKVPPRSSPATDLYAVPTLQLQGAPQAREGLLNVLRNPQRDKSQTPFVVYSEGGNTMIMFAKDGTEKPQLDANVTSHKEMLGTRKNPEGTSINKLKGIFSAPYTPELKALLEGKVL